MPANKKHLTHSGWIRASKITAAILGGFALSITTHLALALVFPRPNVLITMTFSGFILWVTLMMLAFLFKKAWKVWAVYFGLTGVLSLILYFGTNHPIN